MAFEIVVDPNSPTGFRIRSSPTGPFSTIGEAGQAIRDTPRTGTEPSTTMTSLNRNPVQGQPPLSVQTGTSGGSSPRPPEIAPPNQPGGPGPSLGPPPQLTGVQAPPPSEEQFAQQNPVQTVQEGQRQAGLAPTAIDPRDAALIPPGSTPQFPAGGAPPIQPPPPPPPPPPSGQPTPAQDTGGPDPGIEGVPSGPPPTPPVEIPGFEGFSVQGSVGLNNAIKLILGGVTGGSPGDPGFIDVPAFIRQFQNATAQEISQVFRDSPLLLEIGAQEVAAGGMSQDEFTELLRTVGTDTGIDMKKLGLAEQLVVNRAVNTILQEQAQVLPPPAATDPSAAVITLDANNTIVSNSAGGILTNIQVPLPFGGEGTFEEFAAELSTLSGQITDALIANDFTTANELRGVFAQMEQVQSQILSASGLLSFFSVGDFGLLEATPQTVTDQNSLAFGQPFVPTVSQPILNAVGLIDRTNSVIKANAAVWAPGGMADVAVAAKRQADQDIIAAEALKQTALNDQNLRDLNNAAIAEKQALAAEAAADRQIDWATLLLQFMANPFTLAMARRAGIFDFVQSQLTGANVNLGPVFEFSTIESKRIPTRQELNAHADPIMFEQMWFVEALEAGTVNSVEEWANRVLATAPALPSAVTRFTTA